MDCHKFQDRMGYTGLQRGRRLERETEAEDRGKTGWDWWYSEWECPSIMSPTPTGCLAGPGLLLQTGILWCHHPGCVDLVSFWKPPWLLLTKPAS